MNREEALYSSVFWVSIAAIGMIGGFAAGAESSSHGTIERTAKQPSGYAAAPAATGEWKAIEPDVELDIYRKLRQPWTETERVQREIDAAAIARRDAFDRPPGLIVRPSEKSGTCEAFARQVDGKMQVQCRFDKTFRENLPSTSYYFDSSFQRDKLAATKALSERLGPYYDKLRAACAKIPGATLEVASTAFRTVNFQSSARVSANCTLRPGDYLTTNEVRALRSAAR